MNSPDTCLVYVVEDDEAVRASTRALLESAGHAVREFTDAEELLQAGNLAEADYLVFDHNLPGMTGVELLRTLRKGGVAIPVIVVTADHGIEARVLKFENASILLKPFSADNLLLCIENTDPHRQS